MKSSKANKMVNMPEGLILEIENLKSEVHVLRRTVASKTAAVAILHRQLETAHGCQDEIINSMQHKLTQTDGRDCHLIKEMALSSPEHSTNNVNGVGTSSSSVLAELLSASKRENKALKQDLLDLQCKLHDAQADLKVVRSETPRMPLPSAGPLQQHWHRQERLHLIHSLEELTNKVSELEGDVRCLNVEREELLRERQHATGTITRLSRQLKETRREVNGRGENASETKSSCLTNGVGSIEKEGIDHCDNEKSKLTTSGGFQADGSLSSTSDVSTLLQHNRSLLVKLKEAEMELKRTKATVADYELLSSLQAAAHHDNRTLVVSANNCPRAGSFALPSSTIPTSTSVSQPADAATPPPPQTTVVADGTPVSVGKEGVRSCNASGAASSCEATITQATVVPSDGQEDPDEGNCGGSLDSGRSQAVMTSVCPTADPAIDEISGSKTRMDAATATQPKLERQEDTASSETVATQGSPKKTVQHDLVAKRQSSLPHKSEPCGNQVPASKTRTNDKATASKTVPLQSLSSRTFESSTSLRSQSWLSDMDEVSSYGPYCIEGLSISDCIEEIVPIDEIDSYVEEVRRSQSKRVPSRTGSSPQPHSNTGTSDAKHKSHQFQETGLIDALGKNLDSAIKDSICGNVRNSNTDDISKPVDGCIEAGADASSDARTTHETSAANDAFSDYDSDDDQFEAELQQWQQSAVGLLNKTQKRGAH